MRRKNVTSFKFKENWAFSLKNCLGMNAGTIKRINPFNGLMQTITAKHKAQIKKYLTFFSPLKKA